METFAINGVLKIGVENLYIMMQVYKETFKARAMSLTTGVLLTSQVL
jgi:hypothetical protein